MSKTGNCPRFPARIIETLPYGGVNNVLEAIATGLDFTKSVYDTIETLDDTEESGCPPK
jgi:hypothetical protein